MALSARARYMPPVSRFTYPSLRARREAMVLLPAPAGPSMAMISLREVGSAIVKDIDCTRQRGRSIDAQGPRTIGEAASVCDRKGWDSLRSRLGRQLV